MKHILLSYCFLALLCTTVYSLECYSCKDQDGNKDKCIKTSKQCEQNQDVCYSSVQWRIPPYWTPKGNRIHYISKDCDTQQKCVQKEQDLRRFCIRDWYLDWKCHECCSGDLCNYYVTLGSPRAYLPNTRLLLSTFAVAFIFMRLILR